MAHHWPARNTGNKHLDKHRSVVLLARHREPSQAVWRGVLNETDDVHVRTAGAAIIVVGLIVWFPIAALRFGLLFAPSGGANDERIAKTGPSAADLNQAAETRIVHRAFRPVSFFLVGCLLVGGALMLLAG